MGFRVRNQDGEVHFASFRDLHNAFLAGLVEAEDEIQEDGTEGWRRANTFPMLRDIPKAKARAFSAQTVVVLSLSAFALVSLAVFPWWVTLLLAFVAALVLASRTAIRAARGPKR
jgi:hypothetical protein